MIISNENKEKFIFKTKIEFTVDGEKEPQYVVLREMNMAEKNKVLTAGKITEEGVPSDVAGMVVAAGEVFPSCVVESSFTDEKGEPANGKDIRNFLKDSAEVFQSILEYWVGTRRPNFTIKKEGDNPLD